MSLTTRIEKLEAREPSTSGIYHRIVQHLDQTEESAIEGYGRDRIGAADRIIIRRLVEGGATAGGVQ